MTPGELTATAERTVANTLRRLPPDLQKLAADIPVVCHERPSEAILGNEFEPDILGMFAGHAHGEGSGDNNALPPHIMLFLENIMEYVEGDPEAFREEVRITYLHELGHYFGWDENDLELRGLG